MRPPYISVQLYTLADILVNFYVQWCLRCPHFILVAYLMFYTDRNRTETNLDLWRHRSELNLNSNKAIKWTDLNAQICDAFNFSSLPIASFVFNACSISHRPHSRIFLHVVGLVMGWNLAWNVGNWQPADAPTRGQVRSRTCQLADAATKSSC